MADSRPSIKECQPLFHRIGILWRKPPDRPFSPFRQRMPTPPPARGLGILWGQTRRDMDPEQRPLAERPVPDNSRIGDLTPRPTPARFRKPRLPEGRTPNKDRSGLESWLQPVFGVVPRHVPGGPGLPQQEQLRATRPLLAQPPGPLPPRGRGAPPRRPTRRGGHAPSRRPPRPCAVEAPRRPSSLCCSRSPSASSVVQAAWPCDRHRPATPQRII